MQLESGVEPLLKCKNVMFEVQPMRIDFWSNLLVFMSYSKVDRSISAKLWNEAASLKG